MFRDKSLPHFSIKIHVHADYCNINTNIGINRYYIRNSDGSYLNNLQFKESKYWEANNLLEGIKRIIREVYREVKGNKFISWVSVLKIEEAYPQGPWRETSCRETSYSPHPLRF